MHGPIDGNNVGFLSGLPSYVSMDDHNVEIKVRIGDNEKVLKLESKGNFADGELTINNPRVGFKQLSLFGRMNLVGSKRYQVRIDEFIVYGAH